MARRKILQTTAEIYDIFVGNTDTRLLTLACPVHNVKARDNYNTTCMLLRLSGNHLYEALVPANGPASEYSFPRITKGVTVERVGVSDVADERK